MSNTTLRKATEQAAAVNGELDTLYSKCGGSDDCKLKGKDCPLSYKVTWKRTNPIQRGKTTMDSINRRPCSKLRIKQRKLLRSILGEVNVQVPKSRWVEIDLFELYDELSPSQKDIVKEERAHSFCGEHVTSKYNQFMGLIGKSRKLLDDIDKILVIGPGSPIEYDKKGNASKSEIVAFIEGGYGSKIEMIGLKGNSDSKSTSATKDIKYYLWEKLLGVNTINREWIDEDLEIPFSTDKTVAIVLFDGVALVKNTAVIERIIANRPYLKELIFLTADEGRSGTRGIDFDKLRSFGKLEKLFELKSNPPYFEFWTLKPFPQFHR